MRRPRLFQIGAQHPYDPVELGIRLDASLVVTGPVAPRKTEGLAQMALQNLGHQSVGGSAQRSDLRERGEPFVLRGGPLVPGLAVVGMVAILTTLSVREWTAIGVAVVVLAAIYAVLVGLRRRVGS